MLAGLLAGCSHGSPARAPDPPALPASTTATAVAPRFAGAARAACLTDLTTVQTAADAYSTLKGAHPASVAALVSAGFLKEAPAATMYTIVVHPDGTVTGDLSGGAVTTDCSA